MSPLNSLIDLLNFLLAIIFHPKTGLVIGGFGVLLIISREVYKLFYSAQDFREERAATTLGEERAATSRARVPERAPQRGPEGAEKTGKDE